MALIKNSNANQLLKDAVVLDLGDIERQAEALIDRARQEADRILAGARAEAQKLIDEAAGIGHEKGLQEGLAEGRETGHAEGREEVLEAMRPQLQAIIGSWEKALEAWVRDRREMLLEAREDVLAFAFELARRITHRTIAAEPDVVKDQLAEALALVSRPSAVTIVVHPDDRPLIEEVLPNLMAVCSTCEHAAVQNNETIARGGCIVRTERGEIDATIDTQLNRLAETLLPFAKAHQRDDTNPDAHLPDARLPDGQGQGQGQGSPDA